MASNELALQALSSFENLIRDTFVTKATNESNREMELASFLFKNEYELQQQNIAELRSLGIDLPPEFQTDNFKMFADGAGNSNTMEALGSLYAEAKFNNQKLNQSITEYNQGFKLAGQLRSTYAASSEDKSEVDKLMFSETEINRAVAAGEITPGQAASNAFKQGLQTTETEALKLLEINQGLQLTSLQIESAKIDLDEKELDRAQVLHGGTSATTASLVMDRLSMSGINVEFFKDITQGEGVEDRMDMLEELKEEIIGNYPMLAPDIIKALQIYAAPEDMAHTRHHGFVQLGLKTFQIRDRMSELELAAWNTPAVKIGARLERDSSGQLTPESIDRLVSYGDRNTWIEGQFEGEYGDIVGQFVDLSELRLNFDGRTMEVFQTVIDQAYEIDKERLENFANILDMDYDEAYTQQHPYSMDTWLGQQELIVDDLLNEIETLPLDPNLPIVDQDDPFALNYANLPTGLEAIVNAQSDVVDAREIINTELKNLINIDPSISKVIGQATGLQTRDVYGGLEGYTPSEDEVIAIAQIIGDRITNLRTPGSDLGPFGVFKRTEANVIKNAEYADSILESWNAFSEAYKELTGSKAALLKLERNGGSVVDPIETALDSIQTTILPGTELTPEVLDTLFEEKNYPEGYLHINLNR